jgi:hypothetical protein
VDEWVKAEGLVDAPSVIPENDDSDNGDDCETIQQVSDVQYKYYTEMSLHRAHNKHQCDSQLLPQRQLQLNNLINRHHDHDGIDKDVDQTVDEN